MRLRELGPGDYYDMITSAEEDRDDREARGEDDRDDEQQECDRDNLCCRQLIKLR